MPNTIAVENIFNTLRSLNEVSAKIRNKGLREELTAQKEELITELIIAIKYFDGDVLPLFGQPVNGNGLLFWLANISHDEMRSGYTDRSEELRTCWLRLIANATTPETIHAFFQGMMQAGKYERSKCNENAFYLLANTLQHIVVYKKDNIQLELVQNLWLQLIASATTPEAISLFFQGIMQPALETDDGSEEDDEEEQRNAFFWLANALNHTDALDQTAKLEELWLKLLNKASSPEHIDKLFQKMMQSSIRWAKGKNAFYWLAIALNNAAVHDNTAQFEQLQILWLQLLDKATTAESIQALLQDMMQAAENEHKKGTNAFYWLAITLQNAAFYNDTNQVERLQTLWLQLLDKATTHETIYALLQGMMQAAENEPNKGKNVFYLLAAALHEVTYFNNTNQVERLQTLWLQLLDKATTPESIRAILQGMMQAAENGPGKGVNAFYWLAIALYGATYHNNTNQVERSQILWSQLLDKAITPETIQALLQGMMQAAENEPNKGINAFYWLAVALQNAAGYHNTTQVERLQTIWIQLLDKATTSETIHALFQGMMQTAENEPYRGKNAFYCLAVALHHATDHQNSTQVERLQTLWLQLLNKATTPESIQAILQGMMQAAENGPGKGGVNAFYWLAIALSKAAANDNTTQVEQLLTLWLQLLDKATTPETVQALFQGMMQAAENGAYRGINAFYWLASALSKAAVNDNTTQVEQLLTLWLQLLDKATTPETVQALFQGMIQAAQNAFYWLKTALQHATDHQNSTQVERLQTLWLLLLEKLPSLDILDKKTRQLLLSQKKELANLLLTQTSEMSSLGNLDDALRRLENARNPETAPGRLFNTHIGIGFGQTKAIILIDDAIREVKSLMAQQKVQHDDTGVEEVGAILLDSMPSSSDTPPDSAARLAASASVDLPATVTADVTPVNLETGEKSGKGPAPAATDPTSEEYYRATATAAKNLGRWGFMATEPKKGRMPTTDANLTSLATAAPAASPSTPTPGA